MSAPWRGEMRFCFVASSQDEAGAIIDAATHALENCGLFVQGGSCEAMPAQYVIAGSPLAIALAAASGPDDFDVRRDQLHQQERTAAWEAGVTPTPHDPATDGLPSPLRTPEQMTWIHDRFKVDGLERLARADRDYADSHGYYLPDVAALAHAALAALARLRARDQARTDALIEAAWSYRQKADEWDAMAPGRSRTTAAAMALAAADTLTRIAHGDTT